MARITCYTLEGERTLVKEKSINYPCDNFCDAYAVADMFNSVVRLNHKAEEYMYMVALNHRLKPLGVFEISHGTVNYSVISPREIYIRALLCGASSIILAHNHPCGDCKPSQIDITTTQIIREAGKLLNVELLDHIIVTLTDICSFQKLGLIKES